MWQGAAMTCCWSFRQTDGQQCPLHLPPLCLYQALQLHNVQAQNLHSVFEAKPVSQGLHMDSVIRSLLLDRSSLKECKEVRAVSSDFLKEVKSLVSNSHSIPPITQPGSNLERTRGKEKLWFCVQAEETLSSNQVVFDSDKVSTVIWLVCKRPQCLTCFWVSRLPGTRCSCEQWVHKSFKCQKFPGTYMYWMPCTHRSLRRAHC